MDALFDAPARPSADRLAAPGPGRTLSTVVEERALHVRYAAEALAGNFRTPEIERIFEFLFAPRWCPGNTATLAEPLSVRAAWSMANMWLLARWAGATRANAAFDEAEEWFLGPLRQSLPSLAGQIPRATGAEAVSRLSRIRFDEHFQELLPYLLEPHGPGSRRSVMRDRTTQAARDAKRRNGVFYTPADVAEYMAKSVLALHGCANRQLKCLDPSCGTGVYLLALAKARGTNESRSFSYLLNCLYGIDISALAIDACTFVLLHHCIRDVIGRGMPPWSAWHALRLNLVATDSLRIGKASARSADVQIQNQARDTIRNQLLKDRSTLEPQRCADPSCASCEGDLPPALRFQPLGAFFPEAAEGFEVVVGNPPYAPIGPRADIGILAANYVSLGGRKPSAASNVFPLFIEMMWRFAKPALSSSSLVVPLSIAYHQGQQFRRCRRAMSQQGGRWRFAFFDREPDALFGEDVKTRNAIIFRQELEGNPPRGAPADIGTAAFRKWTTRTRSQLFASLAFTAMGSVRIESGVPKVANEIEARAYSALATRTDNFTTLCSRIASCAPSEAAKPAIVPRVFLGGTAYNFLNVFRALPANAASCCLSDNNLHCFEFPTEDAAELGFAILSSRLAFWLWHVKGDGFHVGRWLAQEIPYGRMSFVEVQQRRLQHAGRILWKALQSHRIVSLNKGKRTIAFRPLALEKERDSIDEVLIEAARLPEAFCTTLRAFVRNVVVVDETDHRRKHLQSYFRQPEASDAQ
jgi:hypothetical protein